LFVAILMARFLRDSQFKILQEFTPSFEREILSLIDDRSLNLGVAE
jgi:hypothetical protein